MLKARVFLFLFLYEGEVLFHLSQVDLFSEEELAAKYQDDIEKQCEEIMNFCEDIMRDFKKTDVFEKIPKTSDFIAFCIHAGNNSTEIPCLINTTEIIIEIFAIRKITGSM